MRKLTDMRGFTMYLKQVLRTSQVIAEVVGEQRIVIDEIFIPEERRGIYQNDEDALHFARGRIITDEDPYEQVTEELKARILNNPRPEDENDMQNVFDRELQLAKHEQMTKTLTSLNNLRNLFQEERNARLHEELQWQTLEATFGQYPVVNYPG